jgi:hypothetical protein
MESFLPRRCGIRRHSLRIGGEVLLARSGTSGLNQLMYNLGQANRRFRQPRGKPISSKLNLNSGGWCLRPAGKGAFLNTVHGSKFIP